MTGLQWMQDGPLMRKTQMASGLDTGPCVAAGCTREPTMCSGLTCALR